MGGDVETRSTIVPSTLLVNSAKAASAVALLAMLTNCAESGSHNASWISAIPPHGQRRSVEALGRSLTALPPWVRSDVPWLEVGTRSSTLRTRDFRKRATDGLVYASDLGSNLVNCYPANGFNQPLMGTITNGLQNPQGMTSAGQSIAVANTNGLNVLVYNGCGTDPVRTMNDSAGFPLDVAIDKKGNTYVTNILDLNGSYYTCGEVRKYTLSDNVGVKIGDSNLCKIYFVAVDKVGDIFVDGLVSSNVAELDWLPAGSGTQWKNTGIPLMFPGGLGFDKDGNLLVDDQGTFKFTTYSVPGFKPTGTWFYCPQGDCVSFEFNKGGSEVWIASYAGAPYNTVWGVRYPQGYAQDEISDLSGGDSTLIGVSVTPR